MPGSLVGVGPDALEGILTATAPISPRRDAPRLAVSVGVVAALFAGTGCAARWGLPDPAARQGEAVLEVWRILFWIAAGLGAIVLGLVAWCVVRYRARPGGPAPPQIPGHVPLEVFYTIVPAGIVAFLFILALRTDHRVTGTVEHPDVTVDVTGFQWQWRFDYPDLDGTPASEPGSPGGAAAATGGGAQR